jgi:hypothetical protein
MGTEVMGTLFHGPQKGGVQEADRGSTTRQLLGDVPDYQQGIRRETLQILARTGK